MYLLFRQIIILVKKLYISPILSVKGVSRFFNIGKTKVYELISSGDIHTVAHSAGLRKTWILTSSLLEWFHNKGDEVHYQIMEIPPLLSVSQLSEFFQIGKTMVHRLIKNGSLKSFGVCGLDGLVTKRIVCADSVLNFIFEGDDWHQSCVIGQYDSEMTSVELSKSFPLSMSYINERIRNGEFKLVPRRQKYGNKPTPTVYVETVLSYLTGAA